MSLKQSRKDIQRDQLEVFCGHCLVLVEPLAAPLVTDWLASAQHDVAITLILHPRQLNGELLCDAASVSTYDEIVSRCQAELVG